MNSRQKMKRTMSALVLALCVVLVAVSFGWAYSRETLFRLSEIHFVGTELAIQEELEASVVDFLGKSLFAVSLKELDSVLRRHPSVESVSVKRQWPNSLVIRVMPTQVAALAFINSRLWRLDSDCRPIDAARRPPPLPLLVHADWQKEDFMNNIPKSLCLFLSQTQSQIFLHLDPKLIDEVAWDPDRGAVLLSHGLSLELELGHNNFLEAWKRADLAYGYLVAHGKKVKLMDSSLKRRVVFRIEDDLQFSENELNSKELAHREEPSLPSVR